MAGIPEIEENQEWFYLDSTGQEFGPFPSETMRDWFSQGHFPIGEELLVRLPSWKSHVPLRMIYSEISDAFRSTRGASQGRLVEEASPLGAPSQHFAGYWMMPPAAPYPAAGVGYGFPPPVRPGAYMPAPPRHGGYGAGTGRFEGRIKSFNAKQGFGFIECPEAHAIFGRDVFLHKAQIGDLKVGTQVTYSVEMNKQGMPQARELATLDGHAPGPSPANVVKGGSLSAGGRGKGKNRRKGCGKGQGDPGGFPLAFGQH